MNKYLMTDFQRLACMQLFSQSIWLSAIVYLLWLNFFPGGVPIDSAESSVSCSFRQCASSARKNEFVWIPYEFVY